MKSGEPCLNYSAGYLYHLYHFIGFLFDFVCQLFPYSIGDVRLICLILYSSFRTISCRTFAFEHQTKQPKSKRTKN